MILKTLIKNHKKSARGCHFRFKFFTLNFRYNVSKVKVLIIKIILTW